MIPFEPRLFDDDEQIRRIGCGLLECTLPRAAWTHEAHLAACVWLLRERADIHPETALPTIIARYNESVGGKNDDTQGYHETITQIYVAAVRSHLDDVGAQATLTQLVNALLRSPRGRRDWPLRFYSPERLMSVAARRSFVEPDLAPFAEQVTRRR